MISVIIPTFNRQRSLSQVLPFYLAQEHVEQVIVVDDGSDPPVDERQLPQDQRIEVLHVNHRGPEFARNLGLTHSHNELLFLGEDDAYPARGLLTYLVSQIKRSGVDAIGCRAVYLPHSHNWPQAHDDPINCDAETLFNVNRLELRVTAVLPSASAVPFTTAWALVKKSSLGKHIRFDESLQGNYFRDETDFWLALGAAGGNIVYDSHAVMFHIPRQGGGCHTMPVPTYEFWALWNTYRVLKKHQNYLKTRWQYNGNALLDAFSYEFKRVSSAVQRRLLGRNTDAI